MFNTDWYVQVIHDVIFIVPNQPALRLALIDYARTTPAELADPKGMKRLAGKLPGK